VGTTVGRSSTLVRVSQRHSPGFRCEGGGDAAPAGIRLRGALDTGATGSNVAIRDRAPLGRNRSAPLPPPGAGFWHAAAADAWRTALRFPEHRGVTVPGPERWLDVSVIIPCRNMGNYVGQAIQSVLSQTRQAREIIVVDDNSTDPTLRVVEAFGP